MKLNVLDGFSVMFLFRFRNECPDGKLTKHHLKTLFEKVFPDGRWLPTIWNHLDFVPGNASKITSQIFRIFDSDGNDFLDFKEFLMAIDVANRTTGAFLNFQRIFNPSCEISFCLFFLLPLCNKIGDILSWNRWREAEVDFPAVWHGQQRGDRHGGNDRHHWDSGQHRRGQTRCSDKTVANKILIP